MTHLDSSCYADGAKVSKWARRGARVLGLVASASGIGGMAPWPGERSRRALAVTATPSWLGVSG